MNRLVVRLTFLALLALPACQILGPDDPGAVQSDDPREKWESFNDGNYSFVILRGCFCFHGGTYWVQVINDEVHLALNTYENEEVPAEDLHIFETVDDIFDMIERAEREADELEVEYSNDGYPVTVMIDWIKPAVDDEMYIEISELIPGIQRID